jgi:hypothetical protein
MCERIRTVIVIKGGMVQDVITEKPGEVLVLDLDLQDVPDKEIRKVSIYRNEEPKEAAPEFRGESIWDPYGIKLLFDEAK